jgi:hypothetical protein
MQCSAFPVSLSFLSSFQNLCCSALPPTARGTTASADFYQFNHILLYELPFRIPSPWPTGRSPRVRTITFIPSTRCIYRLSFGQYRISFCFANSSFSVRPYMQFLFIEPGFCLWLLSDSTSRWTPLPSANSSCCQAYSGLSPPGYRSCRAHKMGAR